jgi:hypothetical protein
MTCDQVRLRLSREMDGESLPESPATARHLWTCGDCHDFHATALEVSARYQRHVRSGIEGLRRGAVLTPWSVAAPRQSKARRVALGVSVAAACLLSWCVIDQGKRLVPALPVPQIAGAGRSLVAEASRGLRLSDDLRIVNEVEEDVSLVFLREPLLPLRLDQDLLPARSIESDVVLPPSLRF